MSLYLPMVSLSRFATDCLSPVIAASSPDWAEIAIQLLPSLGLFLFGIVIGVLWFRKKPRTIEMDAGAKTESETDSSSTEMALEPAAELVSEAKAMAKSAPVSSSIEFKLAESRELVVQQRAEITQLGQRFSEIRQQQEASNKRLGVLADAWEASLKSAPAGRGSRAHAEMPVRHLGEILRSERESVEARMIRLENLETRLKEEASKLGDGSEFLSATRVELERRLDLGAGEDSTEEVVDRFSQVEDQLRVLHQNVSGCVQSVSVAREHLAKEQKALGEIAEPIEAAEGLFETSESQLSGDVIDQLETHLCKCRGRLANLTSGIDQEIEEMIGRVDWAICDSSSGFHKAVDKLNEGDACGEPGVILLESDVWRRLGELKGSLAGVKTTLETGAIVAPAAGCGKRKLSEALESALKSVDTARHLLVTTTAPETREIPETVPEMKTVVEASSSSSADAVAKAVAEAESRMASTTEELQKLRFSAAARDGEIAKLRRTLADREAEMETLREVAAKLAAASATESETVAPDANPIAARLAPIKIKKDDSPASSRQFLRRLLGLGVGVGVGAGRHEAFQASSMDNGGTAVVPISVTSLSEARAALSDLRRIPTESPVAVTNGGGGKGGNRFAISSNSPTSAPDEATLRKELAERDDRIAALENELAALRNHLAIAESARVAEESMIIAPVTKMAAVTATCQPPICSIASGESVPRGDHEMVLFRAGDPLLWNTVTGDSTDDTAPYSLSVEKAPEDIDYLRVTRTDTGESVVATITRAELLSGGCAKARSGWSGRGEQYFGATHLGLFDDSLPRDAETKFGVGGWGFGHQESGGTGQVYAWAGQAIEKPEVVFEISVGKLPTGTEIVDTEEGADSPVISSEAVAAAIAATARRDERELADDVIEVAQIQTPVITGPDLDALAKQADRRTSGLILFRANDPTMWGTDQFVGANRRSRSLDRLPDGIAYLRLRRVDNGEGIVIPITRDQLTDDGDGDSRGFNGTNEFFYGAHHLGLFDESLPQDVETRFTYGGWGFGHSALGPEQQSCGWDGRAISPDTVFEIAVFRRMPVLGERDRILDR